MEILPIMRIPAGVLVFLIVIWSNAVLGLDSPFEAQVIFQKRLSEATAPFEKKRTELADQYVGRLNAFQEKFQQSGDLEKSLKTKAELDHFGKHGRPGDQEFSEVSTYRTIFRREIESINRQEDEIVLTLRRNFLKGLETLRDESTRSGELKQATAYDKQIQIHREAIGRLEQALAGKPGLRSFEIAKETETEKILSKFDPRDNVAHRATTEASSSFSGRYSSSNVLKETRPQAFKDFKNKIWALRGPVGWLQLDWETAVKAKTILLINRPNKSKNDRMLKAKLSLNGHEITQIEDFGHYEIGVLILATEINLKELRIEILEGTDYPGLYAIEVYR